MTPIAKTHRHGDCICAHRPAESGYTRAHHPLKSFCNCTSFRVDVQPYSSCHVRVKLNLRNILSDFTDFWNCHKPLVHIPTWYSLSAVSKAITIWEALLSLFSRLPVRRTHYLLSCDFIMSTISCAVTLCTLKDFVRKMKVREDKIDRGLSTKNLPPKDLFSFSTFAWNLESPNGFKNLSKLLRLFFNLM